MHNNYYFLRQLSIQLNERIVGHSVVSCFSQNKDELVIELNDSNDSFFIKANLTPGFCCLSFPKGFHRARKNSIDLFRETNLLKVISVTQFENERSFALNLTSDYSLIFKMHNNFANILLVKQNVVKEIFRNHLLADFDLKPEKMNRVINFGKENFLSSIPPLSKTYFTLGKLVWDYLDLHNFNQLDRDKQWALFERTLRQLEKPNFYLLEINGRIVFSLLPFGAIFKEFSDPILAINELYERLIHDQGFQEEKRGVLHELHMKLKGSESYVKKNAQKLTELVGDHHYQLWGDLIMANLNNIMPGMDTISLANFYDNSTVEIVLKKELNPQRNAEVFYRKAKNQQIEIDKLKEAIARKEKDIEELEKLMNQCKQTSDLKALRKLREHAGVVKKLNKKEETLPFHEFEYKGYRVFVGRNAEANDTLTLKYSFKDDLWLHAKDVAGSHVLIKYQSGKKFPKDVIEYAAGLAAYNSKRKNEALCPVAFTPKKFVRKRKGDPAGMVVVEREQVILVPPVKS